MDNTKAAMTMFKPKFSGIKINAEKQQLHQKMHWYHNKYVYIYS
jgi:hypothetical protein